MPVELIGAIAGAGSFVLDVVKFLAAPIGRPFKHLFNYKTNFKNLEKEVTKLKNTRDEVQVKVTDAERNVEEIKRNVKDWQTKVINTITEAERLIEEKEENPRCFKGLRPNCFTGYKHSKAASELMEDKIDPLLQQEERFDEVSYSSIPLEKNFDKLRDDVLKLKNARVKVLRKVEEAKNNEEEIEEDVKKWLEDVDSIIVKAEELTENQSSIGTDRNTREQNSKAASELMVDDVGPLLQQEERFDKVSYSTIQLSNYEKNFAKLGDDVLKLKNARLKVQHKIEEAKDNVEEIEEDVKKWLEDVDSIIVKAEELIENQSSIGTDRKTRYQNSKAASELMVDNIGPLLQQGERFDKVAHPTIHKEIWLRSNLDYLAFESRNSTVKIVWDALQAEKIYMMGVYGMGGLGKTTLVQEIGRKAEKDKLFDKIVFVEVSETPDTKKIQTAIAKKLGLKFEDEKEDESDRASKLYYRIEKENILLIIDNIWEELDLKTVGIPSEADCGRSKILMTTRNVDVLEKMGSTNNFRMGILNEEEAWSLFKKMAGRVIHTPELNSLPQDVCKECGGLPIVICTIAKALRSKRHPSDWKVALRELRAPSPTKLIGSLEKEYQKIALSYKFLRDDELKKIFLISSLMENNTSISELFIHVVGLDILEGANLTMEDARDRLDKLVRELKDSCLLVNGFEGGEFAMHDVIRVLAITIAYTEHHVFTARNDIEKEWKDKDKLRKCTKISLRDNSIISQLWPKDSDCPDLEYFSYMTNMWGSSSSYIIRENFFMVMPKLKVLNLFRMQQSSFWSSLDLLTNLQTLCLDCSKIEDVAIIGKLKKLEVLSLKSSNIKELPTEMGQLTQLRLLDLSNCWQLEVIASNVISKLSQLEELYIRRCCIQWEVEVLKELKHLSQLTSLEIEIENDNMLLEDLFSKELERYNISIGNEEWIDDGDDGDDWDENGFSRLLELKYDSTNSLEELKIFKNVERLRLGKFLDDDNNRKQLFNGKVIFSDLMVLELKDISFRKIWGSQSPTCMSSLTQLILKDCGNIKYVFPFCIAKSLQTLQHLEISDCKVLEEIIAEEEEPKVVVNFAFPRLTFLKLKYLPKLTTFYNGIDTWELPMLKTLRVYYCEKFTSKFSSELKSFCLEHKINSNLEEFELMNDLTNITWDSRFKTLRIVYDQSVNSPLGLLQRFEKLELNYCGYKEIFSCGNDEKHMQITLGPSLVSFQNLKVLNVSWCRGLMNLITPSMARSLVQLREISVKKCRMLNEIVKNEGDATTSTEIVFENLKKLSLTMLKSLTCFCFGNYSFNFPYLEELIIKDCPNMMTFSQGILNTPKLQDVDYETKEESEKMKVENDLNKTIQRAYSKQDISLELKLCVFKDINSTKISYNQHPTSFYQNLTHLILWNCGNVKYAFPCSITKNLHRLQQLKIQNCKVLEEIVAKEEGANAVVNFVFPNVTLLKLEDLPEFMAFCSERHAYELPKLKELVVRNCEKFMNSKYLSFQENDEEGELHISKPKSLFLDDKINHDLKVFKLRNGSKLCPRKNIEWQSQSKALRIQGDELANIPLGLLQRFENLKAIQLCENDYKELFFPNLPNLEVLHVRECKKLMRHLVSSSTSFQNLNVLRVAKLRGLMKLITPSTARSLVQLREMSVDDSEMLVEIVENEGDATTSTEIIENEGDAVTRTEIVFDNLKTLSLKWLESLTYFCSGNYSFNFPSLEELNIVECPNMKSFSQGILSTPKLTKIINDWKEKDLENGGSELNTIIQQAHNKKG